MREMSPQEITASLQIGDICLVRGDDSTLGEVIRIGQSLEGGAVATWNHAMIHSTNGILISPEEKVVMRQLVDYLGRILRFWWDPDIDQAKKSFIADDAMMQLGRRYDYLGLVGQGLRGVFSWIGLNGVGNWLAGVFQRPSRWFCSEMVAWCYRWYTDFCDGNKQPSPQDIDDWCRQAGWQCLTVLVKAE